MILYKTVKKEAVVEQSVEKSKFVTHIKHVETKEEADDFITSIKSKYKDADHNVPAMVLGDKFQIQWASDDGEPQGTSGAPMVQMLVKEEITNVVVVVTRYFGGIKLGTGGLVRAYTASARLGLEAAGIREVREMIEMVVRMEYHFLSKIQNMEKKGNFFIKNTKYEDVIFLKILCEKEKIDKVKALFSNVTGGTQKIVSEVEKNT